MFPEQCRAVKLVKVTPDQQQRVQRERNVLNILLRAEAQHSNVVQFFGEDVYNPSELPRDLAEFFSISFVGFEFEYVNGGTLFEHYWKEGPLREVDLRLCATYVAQYITKSDLMAHLNGYRHLLSALEFLHGEKLGHCDIKPVCSLIHSIPPPF